MNIVMFETTIRQDKEGRYCLNDLHKAAIASGLDVERKNPSDFFRTDMAKDFIESLLKVTDTDTENPVTPYTSVKGGKNQGTYAVRLLAQRYCGWLSSDFEVIVYSAFDKFIQSEQQRIYERQAARLEFPGMTQALIESRTDQGKKTSFFHYSNEADMINKITTGYTAKKLREKLGIDSDEPLREYLTATQITAIGYLQRTNTTLIEEGYSFEDRKQKLTERFEKKFSARVKQEFDEKLMLLNC